MLIKGVLDRWPDLSAAREAKAILEKNEQGADRDWELQDIAHQRKFLVARARGLSDYATGPLPQQYANQRAGMAEGAIKLWNMVIDDGQDKEAVADGKKRLVELLKLVDNGEK